MHLIHRLMLLYRIHLEGRIDLRKMDNEDPGEGSGYTDAVEQEVELEDVSEVKKKNLPSCMPRSISKPPRKGNRHRCLWGLGGIDRLRQTQAHPRMPNEGTDCLFERGVCAGVEMCATGA